MRNGTEGKRGQGNVPVFFANPFGFANTLLGEKRNGQLEATEEELNVYLGVSMSDPDRNRELWMNNRLITQNLPEVAFNSANLVWNGWSGEICER